MNIHLNFLSGKHSWVVDHIIRFLPTTFFILSIVIIQITLRYLLLQPHRVTAYNLPDKVQLRVVNANVKRKGLVRVL